MLRIFFFLYFHCYFYLMGGTSTKQKSPEQWGRVGEDRNSHGQGKRASFLPWYLHSRWMGPPRGDNSEELQGSKEYMLCYFLIYIMFLVHLHIIFYKTKCACNVFGITLLCHFDKHAFWNIHLCFFCKKAYTHMFCYQKLHSLCFTSFYVFNSHTHWKFVT